MRLHSLQYLRAIAALVVVYSHACIQVPAYRAQLMEFGSFGVDIFFVISGFIMLYISKPHHTPKAFIANRIRRVAPLYWFFTLLMAVIFLILPSVFANTELRVEALIQSLFFIPHFSDAHPGEVWPIVAPGWSLNYEMYFYAVFALSLFAAQKYRLWIISVVIIAVFVLAHALNSNSALSEFFTDTVVFEFIFGMLLAYAWQRGFRLPSWLGAILLIVGFALLIMHSQNVALAALDLPGIVTYGIPATMVVAGTLFIKLPENGFGILLGDASYALYLSHIFVLGLLRIVLPPILGDDFTAAILFVLISLVVCLTASIPIHQYIDNWLLKQERLGHGPTVKQREA